MGVIYLSGFVVINVVATVLFVRSQRGKAAAELMTFAETVPAPLTPQVREWLGPQLHRRAVYPFVGFLWGITAVYLLPSSAWDDLPWHWFLLVIGIGVGSSTGALLASVRTKPLVDGPRRAVDPVRRRASDYYGRIDVLRLRLSVLTAGSALALAAALVAGTGTATADRALIACSIGLVLVAAQHGVVAVVVARPLVTSTAEGLSWQKAVLARTIAPMPHLAIFAGIFSTVVAVYAAVVHVRELSLPILLLSVGVAVLGAAAVVVMVMGIRRDRPRQTDPIAHPSSAP
ncbi:hypothetical protein [Nocardioides marinisabuli]|uniref:hypothetical protein n=1 Tax=Nocardioides marinisabuli TaxID=419476 RepID=UPI0015DEE693|nr:hypothetical protein [Nocardioides marinisabuli]